MSESTTATGENILQALEGLVPQWRERGPETEEMGRLPETTLADLDAAGVFRALRPVEAGGLGVGLREFTDIIRVLSRGDASVGWLGGLYTAHAWMLSRLDKQAQDEIFGDKPSTLATVVTSQPGSAEVVEGGYRVTGRWRFASGILHADWALFIVFSEDGPLACAIPRHEITVHDTWHVPGMKATGSNDAEVTDVFVPAHRTLSFQLLTEPDSPGADLYDYPLLRYPVPRVLPLIHAAVALGVADAALELFPEVTEGRVRLQNQARVIEEPATHELYGQAVFERRCSELLIRDACEILDAGFGGEAPGLTLEQRADLNLAIAGSTHRAFASVDLLVQAAGASIHRTGQHLDRICRDTQVMRNHTLVDWRYHATTSGRVLMGQGLGPLMDFQF
ncbi:hypothetical protein GTY44_42135 [Streptomyces sp. SID5914]|nr:hypothetical protein [Streptomyces sp. SID5914]MZG20007.1 hypothetical protein [Streptomyces sp. SID5914]